MNVQTGNGEMENYGYVMMRPDAIELGLDQSIIARLEAAGFVIVKHAMCVISERQVNGLYPNLHERSYYAAMKAGMVGRQVMSLIVAGGGDIGQRLLAVKGSALSPSGSIRADFSGGHLLSGELGERFLAESLTDEDLCSEPITAIMREDRVHTDETAAEALNSIRVMFPMSELEDLASCLSAFSAFLHNV